MELVRMAYGAMAQRYITLFGSSAQVLEDDLALITRHLSIVPGVVLDVGCGPGHLTDFCPLSMSTRWASTWCPSSSTTPALSIQRAATRSVRCSNSPFPTVPSPGSWRGTHWSILLPDGLDCVLTELRRVTAAGGTLVAGFFDGEDLVGFEHAVVTAYYWPVDELSARLRRAGFMEIERELRPGIPEPGRRPNGAIVAIAG
jgi:SAM-dependent methyltransferase